MEEDDHPREQPRYRGQSPRRLTYKPSTSPSLRGLLDPEAVDVWSRQVKLKQDSISSRFRFESSRFDTQVPEHILFVLFALFACGRWLFGRGTATARQQSPPDEGLEPQRGRDASDEKYVSVKYAAKPTIRQGLRTSTGSRAKRREKTVVFGLSYHPEAGHDYAESGGATNAQASPLSWSPRPNPPCPPTIDEVLQNSVRGFREPWWKTSCSSYAADEGEDILRADEAEGCDMPPETKAFLDEYVFKLPRTARRTRPATGAVEGEQQKDTCLLLPSPSLTNAAAAGDAHGSVAAKQENTGRAQVKATKDDEDNIDTGASTFAGVSLPEPTGDYHGMMGSSFLAGVSPPEAVPDNIIVDVSGSCTLPGVSPGSVDSSCDMVGSSILAGCSPDTTTNNDSMTESSIPVGSSPAFASSTLMFSVRHTTCFQTLSVVDEEQEREEDDEEDPGVLLLSRVVSSTNSLSSQGSAFPPPPSVASAAVIEAVIETVIGVADGEEARLGEEPEKNEHEDDHEYVGDDARSGGSSDIIDVYDGLLFQSCKGKEGGGGEEEGERFQEEEEGGGDGGDEVYKSFPLTASAVVASAVDERFSMTDRLVGVLRSLTDRKVAVRGEYLARNCSLSPCDTNTDLTWHEVLGEGTFGRVSLVEHKLGRYALKELTEEAGLVERWCARNEMEALLRVSGHENVIRAVAMDPTIPSMPIMLEAGSRDMYDVICDDDMSMPIKISLLLEAAWGLSHVHEKGLVHCDIKAANIVVVGEGDENTLSAKIADFGIACDIGTLMGAGTGTPGYIPAENLRDAIEAGPDGDVFSFAVVMLLAFVLPEFRVKNPFAHRVLMTIDERLKRIAIHRAGWDINEVLDAQRAVNERCLFDGSFAEIMLRPERMDDAVPNKSLVCNWLRRCLSTDRGMRPTMEAVAGMLEDLLYLGD